MAALSTSVTALGQTLEANNNRLAQAAGEILKLQGSDNDLLQGAAEIAGRVVAVEEQIKIMIANATSTTQATPGAQDPWSMYRNGPASAPAAQPTLNMAQRGLFGEQPMGQGVGKPEMFDVGSPVRRERAPYNSNWRFDTKMSLDSKSKYDPKDTAAWLLKVKN